MNRLRSAFPYLAAPALWHLSEPHLNPFGSAALIPIFYYMFSDRKEYWLSYGCLMCFLLDYNAGTFFLFTALFLSAHAVNEKWGVLNSEAGAQFNIRKFNMFLGAVMLSLLVFAVFNSAHFWNFLVGTIWLYLWLLILYMPFVAMFRWVKK
jgi:hypothetical protein